MSNLNTNPARNEEGTSKGGTKAAGIALGGTVALAGAAFLASQYFDEETSSGDDTGGTAEVKTDTVAVKEDLVWQESEEGGGVESGLTDNQGNQGGDVNASASSFDEAFAAARAEHGGGGGHFSWKGDVYNTYTVEEWNTMSVEQRSDFVAGVVHGEGSSSEQVAGDYSSEQPDTELESTTVVHENGEIIIPVSESDPSEETSGSNLSGTSTADAPADAIRGNDLSSVDYILDNPDDSAIITVDPAQAQTHDVASIDVIEVVEDETGYTDIHDSHTTLDNFDSDWTA